MHTGQHYDDELSAVFFAELGIPRPDASCASAAGRTPSRPRACSRRSAPLLRRASRPTPCSSTATRTRRWPAGSRPRRRGIPVAHVEAGMRSFDRAMPEELNRVLTDHLVRAAALPSAGRGRQPRARGRRRARSSWSATSWSTSRCCSPRARAPTTAPLASGRRARRASTSLATAHRAGNVDDPAPPGAARRAAARGVPRPVVLPLHPRTRARLEAAGLLDAPRAAATRPAPAARLPRVHLAARPRPRRAHRLRRRAEGGLPRRRAVRDAARHAPSGWRRSRRGWNVLVDLDADAALAALARPAPAERPELYGDGQAGGGSLPRSARLLRS